MAPGVSAPAPHRRASPFGAGFAGWGARRREVRRWKYPSAPVSSFSQSSADEAALYRRIGICWSARRTCRRATITAARAPLASPFFTLSRAAMSIFERPAARHTHRRSHAAAGFVQQHGLGFGIARLRSACTSPSRSPDRWKPSPQRQRRNGAESGAAGQQDARPRDGGGGTIHPVPHPPPRSRSIRFVIAADCRGGFCRRQGSGGRVLSRLYGWSFRPLRSELPSACTARAIIGPARESGRRQGLRPARMGPDAGGGVAAAEPCHDLGWRHARGASLGRVSIAAFGAGGQRALERPGGGELHRRAQRPRPRARTLGPAHTVIAAAGARLRPSPFFTSALAAAPVRPGHALGAQVKDMVRRRTEPRCGIAAPCPTGQGLRCRCHRRWRPSSPRPPEPFRRSTR